MNPLFLPILFGIAVVVLCCYLASRASKYFNSFDEDMHNNIQQEYHPDEKP
jgi:hypothetical protein